MILYLLPFKSGTDFKFGITNSDRIKMIDKIYSVDFNRAKIVSAKRDRIVRGIETYLKTAFADFITDKYKGKDGATEILPIEYWDRVIHAIEYFRVNLGWLEVKVENYSFRKVSMQEFEQTTLDKAPQKRTPQLEYSGYFETLNSEHAFLLQHPYGKRLIQLAKEGKDNAFFSEYETPGIRDFYARISGLKLNSEIRFKKIFEKITTTKRIYSKTYYFIPPSLDDDQKSPGVVQFNFTKEFIQDASCGHLELLLEIIEPCKWTDLIFDLPCPADEMRRDYSYLTSKEDFEATLAKYPHRFPEKAKPELQLTMQEYSPLLTEARLNVANEEDWRALWYESRQHQKCKFEDFLVRGGYQNDGNKWIKYY